MTKEFRSADLKTQWDLSEYYSGLEDPKLASDIAGTLPAVESFAQKWKGKIREIDTAEKVLEYYEDNDILSKKIDRPLFYLFYRSSLDTQDTEIIRKNGEMESLHVRASEILLFASQEWKELGEERIRKFADETILAPYRNALLSKAENLKFLLSEKEEFVLNKKSRTLSVAESLREELTNSYVFPITLNGESKTMTEEEVRALRMSADRDVRRAAHASLRSVYGSKQAQITLGNVYSQIVKDWVSDVELRGFESVMHPRNSSEELESAVVDMLLSEVQAAYPLFARYLRAKKRLLGLEDMSSWDVMAPIGWDDAEISYEQAVDLHLSAMADFDAEFHEYSVDMLTSGRVDAFPKFGKRSGAFAQYDKGHKSFVLLNYTNKSRDVATLSHELGHAIHGHLSQGQKSAVYGSPLSLAETASIFSELLLSEKLDAILPPEARMAQLNNRLEDVFATIFRQVQYVLFERRVHEAIMAGEELTYKEYNAMWREEQLKMSGDAIAYDVPPEEECTWSMIPHIFASPFYCYAYSFGNILVFSLFDAYKQNGAEFVESYKDILRAGGSKRPKELLSEHGIDITKPEFYRNAFRQIERMVVDFEASVP